MHSNAIQILYCRYIIPLEDSAKLEALAAKIAIEMDCDFYLRHKTIMIPPSILHKNGINFARVCNIVAFFKESLLNEIIFRSQMILQVNIFNQLSFCPVGCSRRR